MSALPRAECPWCGCDVPVRRNGAFREHNAYGAYGAPAYSKCEGSGQSSLTPDDRMIDPPPNGYATWREYIAAGGEL